MEIQIRESESRCFRGYDPFEDTESLLRRASAYAGYSVSGATIRLRILKEEEKRRGLLDATGVSGATIRLRILKGTRDRRIEIATVAFQGLRSV